VLAVTARGELREWVQFVQANNPLEAIYFRTVALPAGPVQSLRPPRETIADLSKAIAAAPQQVELLALRAREAEQLLDFPAATADWRKYADATADKFQGQLALADFYHRRLQPTEESQALAAARNMPSPAEEKFTEPAQQRSWKLFERSLALANVQALPVEAATDIYREWVARYADQPAVYTRFFDHLNHTNQIAPAEALLASYQKAFPADQAFPLRARATITQQRGTPEQAVAIYDAAFQPLWPPDVMANYFQLLQQTRGLRKFLENARSAATANPGAINPAARLFYYYQQQGNLPQAERSLLEYQARKQSFTADELYTLAKLFEAVHSYSAAARNYFALCNLPGATPTLAEKGLSGLIEILFTAPEQPIQIGAGDLSYYKDVATMDPYPGALNGFLSLLFNSTNPARKFADQGQASVAYFHRAKASEFLTTFDTRFPQSEDRPRLHAKLIEAYAAYGDSDGVSRQGRQFLASFPKAAERTDVSLLIADAHARRQQTKEEFAVYDALLKELSAAAGGMPIGIIPAQSAPEPEPPADGQEPRQPAAAPARSPNYARVLDRYIARLVSLKRTKEALVLYRGEIDRNPNDPGLYERLAVFLNQNKLAADLEQTYIRATQQFQDRTWHHKLARWYLRQKQTAQFDKLTKEIVTVFTGTDLEKYFRDVVGQGTIDPVLYRQVNLYAYQRFPHDMVFVRNLLRAYTTKGTVDNAAWERLLRNNWYYDEALRSQFFEYLSRTNKLDTELSGLRRLTAATLADRAAAQMIAEAQAWRSHFEEAAPVLQAVANNYPAEAALGERTASIHRSLLGTDVAAAIEDKLSRSDPRDTKTLARIGEIYADKEQFDKARTYWNRIATVEPGRRDGYLEAATVFWDYFLYDDALRLIGDGRRQLKSPAMFAFEAGAIQENRRDYPQAIAEYIKGATAAEGASPSQSRLLLLARRPALRSVIEDATQKLSGGPNPPNPAFALRVAVLESQDRLPDLNRYLSGVSTSTNSFELLSRIDTVAERQGFDNVREQSLNRQIAITTDPVDRTRLRLTLARFYESKPDISAAARTIDAVYKDNPQILGVVRAAVDFYWRNKQGKNAVDTLERAAGISNAVLKRSFTLEAVRKATDVADYQRARRLLNPRLTAEPIAGDLVAAMADTYAREGDDKSLRTFLDNSLQKAGKSEQSTVIRRSLIPVLTRLKDYQSATEQYIQIINRYPEDAAVVQEAAAYARKNSRTQQLTAFYEKAVTDSPRDSRWPVVLARLDTELENFPGAVEAYTKAIAIRPDRTDLYTSMASLEERLLHFDNAAKAYTKLYDLTYHNPQWMVKLAETRARQSQPDAAVKALRTAFLEGGSTRSRDYFEVARKLESWNFLPQAKEFADQGLKVAPKDDPETQQDLRFYLRLAARLRTYDAAYQTVAKLSPPESRMGLINEVAAVAKGYFTPEEKTTFGTFLQKVRIQPPAMDLTGTAQTAGLNDLAVRWMQAELTAKPNAESKEQLLPRLAELQGRRLRYDDLGKTIEAFWKAYPQDDGKDQLLVQAADAYRQAGSPREELRVLTLLNDRGMLTGAAAERFNKQLRASTPEKLVAVAQTGASDELRDGAANTAVSGNDAALALRAITARGTRLPPVWTKAYTALTGLYFNRATADVNAAFQATLGPNTIGEQLGHPVARDQQLAGDLWFYYGSRYGEYLAVTKQPNADDYLPAALEGTPANGSAYFELAEYYRESGAPDRALEDYDHALQFNANRGDVHSRIAEILWSQGKRDEAKAHWKQAFQMFAVQQDQRRVPESFWNNVQSTLEAVGKYKVLADVRPDADRLLRTYIYRNGLYRVEPLLQGVLAASATPTEGVRWIADLARRATDPVNFLGAIVSADYLPAAGKEIVYQRLLEIADLKVSQARGDAQRDALQNKRRYQLEWLETLVATKQTQRAQAALATLDPDARRDQAFQVVSMEVRIAAQSGALEALLTKYAANKPPLDMLRHSAGILKSEGDAASSRRILEFVYNSELELPAPAPSSFLGLAEVRLESQDPASAVTLLRRMALVTGEPFENLESAASLLDKFGREKEALEFRNTRAQAVPWDKASLVLLQAGKGDAPALRTLAASPDTPYANRIEAAAALAKVSTDKPALGSGELDLMASGTPIDAAASERPYYWNARMKAATQATNNDVKIRLLRGALEIDPQSNVPRLPLFQAAMALNRNMTAIGALIPLIGGQQRLEQEYSSNSRYLADEFLYSTLLPVKDRARIARELAGIFRKIDSPQPALTLLRISQHLDPAAPSGLAALEAEQTRIAANELRRPLITKNLEQERNVRPRL
jgi:Tfp pilus assembly protein PilF